MQEQPEGVTTPQPVAQVGRGTTNAFAGPAKRAARRTTSGRAAVVRGMVVGRSISLFGASGENVQVTELSRPARRSSAPAQSLEAGAPTCHGARSRHTVGRGMWTALSQFSLCPTLSQFPRNLCRQPFDLSERAAYGSQNIPSPPLPLCQHVLASC